MQLTNHALYLTGNSSNDHNLDSVEKNKQVGIYTCGEMSVGRAPIVRLIIPQ
jgi:hypothetical protein